MPIRSSGTADPTLDVELTLIDTPDIIVNPLLIVNTSELAGAESCKFRLYRKILSGDSYAIDEEESANAGQYPVPVSIRGEGIYYYGCKATLLQANTGSARDFKWALIDNVADGVTYFRFVTGTLEVGEFSTSLSGLTADALKGRRVIHLGTDFSSALGKGSGIINTHDAGGVITLEASTPLAAAPANGEFGKIV